MLTWVSIYHVRDSPLEQNVDANHGDQTSATEVVPDCGQREPGAEFRRI